MVNGATGVGEDGSNVQSHKRLKFLKELAMRQDMPEVFRLRALLVGLSTVTKERHQLSETAKQALSQDNLRTFEACLKLVNNKGMFMSDKFKDFYKKVVTKKLKSLGNLGIKR